MAEWLCSGLQIREARFDSGLRLQAPEAPHRLRGNNSSRFNGLDMDQSVIDAIARWPNVPAVAGWLSLSSRGEWRLHPSGDAQQGGPGVGVSNTQMLSFFGRNYASEADGRYFFQNGPQRVYVRLDAAPFILHLIPQDGSVRTHNGLTVKKITRWLTDDLGNIYADTDLGPARMDDRDLFLLADLLVNQQGTAVLDCIEQGESNAAQAVRLRARPTEVNFSAMATFAPLQWVQHENIGITMNFIANPAVPVK